MNSTTLNGAPKMGALDIVRINVGGTIFMTSRKTLKTFPGTKLDQLGTNCGEYDEKSDSYFFDRNPVLFNYVLDCYRSGRFHFPSYLCGDSVMEELCFWGLDDNVIANCCLKSYDDYEERRHTLEAIYKTSNCDMRQKARTEMLDNTGLRRMRYQLWLFLEYPNSSTSAKVWSFFNLFLVLASVLSFCLQTCPEFRQPSPFSSSRQETPKAYQTSFDKGYLLRTTDAADWIVYFDVLINSLFTVDLFICTALSPNIRCFLKGFLTWIEIICLATFWSYQGLTFYSHANGNFATGSIGQLMAFFFIALQPLRTLRFLKLSHVFVDYRAILLSIRYSLKEFFVLCIFVVTAMFFFSITIFIAEFKVPGKFSTIPESFWWAVITMTTVGYGDVVPETSWGYAIACVCAICGIIITGLAISVLSNKLSLYQIYAKIECTALKRKDHHNMNTKSLCK
ncbi:potassium voltage-gated channel protein Shaw-like isoform X2 [Lineus longissimus]|uniref:potassium voltage-gated channel protein Shaw-like isoform X2 n=1 Tax=Lineus longissimus TaxID=88925 RepID=UPI00315D3E5E